MLFQRNTLLLNYICSIQLLVIYRHTVYLQCIDEYQNGSYKRMEYSIVLCFKTAFLISFLFRFLLLTNSGKDESNGNDQKYQMGYFKRSISVHIERGNDHAIRAVFFFFYFKTRFADFIYSAVLTLNTFCSKDDHFLLESEINWVLTAEQIKNYFLSWWP